MARDSLPLPTFATETKEDKAIRARTVGRGSCLDPLGQSRSVASTPKTTRRKPFEPTWTSQTLQLETAVSVIARFGDSHDTASTCRTLQMNNEIDRRVNLTANGLQWQLHRAREHHGFKAAKRIGRSVGMTGRE